MNSATLIRRNLPNPLPVSTDLITQKRFEFVVTAALATFNVTLAQLVASVPGGIALWDKAQLHSIDVFSGSLQGATATTYAPVTATLQAPSATGAFGDKATGYSDPVGLFRRAHVGFTPNELYRTTWFDSADTTPFLIITTPHLATEIAAIIQVVMVLRSTGTTVNASDALRVEAPDAHNRSVPAPSFAPVKVLTIDGGDVMQVEAIKAW